MISLVLIAVLMLLRRAVVTIVFRRTEDVRTRYYAGKVTSYVCVTLSLVILTRIWFAGFRDLGTFLGLVSAGLAIALKDVIVSVAGWVYLLWQRPFDVGDRIQIGDHAGDVIDKGLLRFTMLEIGNWAAGDQSTGRLIHVPNSRVFTDAIANYTKKFQYIWNEISVLVTFESNWQRAKDILQRIADERSVNLSESAMTAIMEAARRVMIVYSTLKPKVWTSIAESGVLLTIRYLCDPRQRRVNDEMIWEEILREFHACDDIDFAYPTVRRYMHEREGKAAIRAVVSPDAVEHISDD